MNADRDAGVFDSYCGIEMELSSGPVVLQALRVRDGYRILRLAQHAARGDERAALEIAHQLPRAVGLSPDAVQPEDVVVILARCFDPDRYSPEPREKEPPPAFRVDGPPIEVVWGDLLADYAAAYGGPPRPDDPWPLFMTLLNRSPKFDARARLQLVDSVSMAIAAALGNGRDAEHHRAELLEQAYPGHSPEPVWVENLARVQPAESPPTPESTP